MSPQVPAVRALPLPTVTEPPVDLTPVATPATLFVTGRLAKPSASLATIRGWSRLPMPQSAQVTEAMLGAAVGELVDTDQPIDFAIGLGGVTPRQRTGLATLVEARPRLVVSAAIRNERDAKASLSERYKLVPSDNGSLLIVGLGGAPPRERDAADDVDKGDDADGEHRTCELSPAFGAVAMRLLCSWGSADGRALQELGPWLTRDATRATSPADLRIDVRMDPLKAAVGKRLKMVLSIVGSLVSGSLGLPGPRDLIMSAIADIGDFALDVDTASFDLDLSDPVARAVATVNFSSTSSVIARVATANPDKNGPPPATLWQMPGDADFAFFERGIDAKEAGQVRGAVLKAVSGQLGEDGVPASDANLIVGALAKLPWAAPTVYAAGLDVAAFKVALDALGPAYAGPDAKDRFELVRRAGEAGMGWHVVEFDEPSTNTVQAMNELVAVWLRPGVAAAYRAKWKDVTAPTLRSVPMPKRGPNASWPPEARHFVIELRPARPTAGPTPPAKAAALRKPFALHILVVPSGAKTWVALGGDEVLAGAKVAVALGNGSETLGGRAELSSLREANARSGGFVTMRGLIATVLPGATLFGWSGPAGELFSEVNQLPHQGVAPLAFWTTPQTTPPLSSVTSTVQVPRAAIEDLIAALLRHGI